MLDRLRHWWQGIVGQSPENPSTPLSNPDKWLIDWFGGGPTEAGVFVNEQTALRTSAVYACVMLLAKIVGSLPLKVLRRLPNGDISEVPDNPMFYLLHDEPNPVMTSAVWREYLMTSVLLRGNAYVAIGRNQRNQIVDLFPIPPDRVTPERLDGRMIYHVRLNGGGTETLDQANVLHIPGMAYDGVRGVSVITWARNSIGLAVATETHGAKLFANGARTGLILKHPKTLSKEAQQRLRAQFDAQHSGLSNAFRTMVLEEGLDVSHISMTAEDAQFLETRQLQVEDIARFFGVPPHMIGHTTKQTSWGSGVEQMFIGFLITTLIPWLTRFEQEFNRKLFPRSPFYAQFKHQGLLRGDSAARAAYYASGHQNGWLTVNEIRRAEDLPPVPGGDVLYVQTNLAPVGATPIRASIRPADEELLCRPE